MSNFFEKLILRFRPQEPAAGDGIRVLQTREGLCIERRSGAVMESRFLAPGAKDSVMVRHTLDGVRSTIEVHFLANPELGAWECLPGSETACIKMHEQIQRGLARGKSGQTSQPRHRWKTALAVLALSVAAALLWPGAHRGPDLNANAASAAEGGLRLSLGEFATLASLPGIKERTSGMDFRVFSDPNCPYCRELERSLAKLDPKFNPVLLPLGFKDGSRDTSAAILCSANPAEVWGKYVLDGVAPQAKPCEKGYAQVDANMEFFRKMRLNSFPTMVTPGGFLVVGTGAPEQIAEVLSK
jgi:hypothetical protein